MKKIDVLTLGEMCETMLDREPVFILRAHDPAALAALERYVEASQAAGGRNIIRTRAAMDRFRGWQTQHKDDIRPAD